jgi:hypothetical protein
MRIRTQNFVLVVSGEPSAVELDLRDGTPKIAFLKPNAISIKLEDSTGKELKLFNEPAVKNPVVAQPVVEQPVVAQPVVAQPVTSPASTMLKGSLVNSLFHELTRLSHTLNPEPQKNIEPTPVPKTQPAQNKVVEPKTTTNTQPAQNKVVETKSGLSSKPTSLKNARAVYQWYRSLPLEEAVKVVDTKTPQTIANSISEYQNLAHIVDALYWYEQTSTFTRTTNFLRHRFKCDNFDLIIQYGVIPRELGLIKAIESNDSKKGIEKTYILTALGKIVFEILKKKLKVRKEQKIKTIK